MVDTLTKPYIFYMDHCSLAYLLAFLMFPMGGYHKQLYT